MRRSRTFVALLFALVLLLQGCGSTPTDTTTRSGEAPGAAQDGSTEQSAPRKITWLLGASPEQLAKYQAFMDKAEQDLNVDVEINTTTFENFGQKIQTLIAARENPEFWMGGTDFVPWAARGAMKPLDDYIAKDNFDLSQFDQKTVDAFKWNGQLWRIPTASFTVVLFYNEDMFKAAGVDLPPTDWSDTSWNWDRFVETAKKLTLDKNGKNALDPAFDPNNIVQYGIGDMQWYFLYPWYFGGDWSDKEGTTFTGNSPEVIQGLQAVADLVHKHHVMPSQTTVKALGGDLFATSKAAMTMNGNWAIASYKEKTDLKWNIAASPVGKQHSIVLFTDGVGVGDNSKNPDAMWELITWTFANDERANEFIQAAGGGAAVPAKISLQKSFIEDSKEAVPGLNVEVLTNAFSVPEARPIYLRYNKNWSKIETELNTALEQLWLGTKDAATIMKEVEPKIQQLMKE